MDGGVFRDNGDRVQRTEAYSGLLDGEIWRRGALRGQRKGVTMDRGVLRGYKPGMQWAGAYSGILEVGCNGQRRTQGCWKG